ncbi:MAG: DUF3500 domain-containing protein [Pseudomonadota bacterium]
MQTPDDMHQPRPVSRRAVLMGAGALAVAGQGLNAGGRAMAAQTGPTGQRMRELATDWLAQLDAGQRKAATFRFDSQTRRRWNYMLGSAFANGLALERMSAPQKDTALLLLATALSAEGMDTAESIMLQQDILRDEWGKGSPDRNRERFSVQIFGTPSPSEPWGWRWEGHHLTITFTLMGDAVIAQTPKAFSSEPNTVPSGPHKGLVVLPENETLGRALYAELSATARRAALLRERSFGNILAKPGRETRIQRREGVALGDLPPPQADKARRLIDIYTSAHLSGPLAAVQRDRIAAEDGAAIRFAWAGPNIANESMYYRIHGATFLIEFATLFGQPLHHHTIVHDPERNFGDHLVG